MRDATRTTNVLIQLLPSLYRLSICLFEAAYYVSLAYNTERYDKQ